MNIFVALVMTVFLGILPSCGSHSTSDKEPDMQPSITIDPVPNQIQYETYVPQERKEALNEAISFIYKFPLSQQEYSSTKLMRIMKISDVNPGTLQNWLEKRVHIIIDDDNSYDSRKSFADTPVKYPEPDEFPTFFETKSFSKDDSEPQLVMSNVGASYYFDGKKKKQLVKVRVQGVGEVPIISPRVGILQIGPGLFPDFGRRVQNIVLAAMRAETLFHEARHSDGHGKTAAFGHSKCPSGHDYAGYYACDVAKNGPYTIGAELIKGLLESCQYTCTELTKSVLKVLYYDNLDRVLSSSQLPASSKEYQIGKDWDDSPESIGDQHKGQVVHQ